MWFGFYFESRLGLRPGLGLSGVGLEFRSVFGLGLVSRFGLSLESRSR